MAVATTFDLLYIHADAAAEPLSHRSGLGSFAVHRMEHSKAVNLTWNEKV